jgi:hypothetical protein
MLIEQAWIKAGFEAKQSARTNRLKLGFRLAVVWHICQKKANKCLKGRNKQQRIDTLEVDNQ